MSDKDDISFNKIRITKLSNTHGGLADFKCSKPEFAEYLKITAFHDQEEQVGQTWLFTYEGIIIGFITIAMAHMEKNKHMQTGTFGNIPAMLIGHLATHKDYERKGVGQYMVYWTINKATELSETIGCRAVMLNPEKDARKFYEKLDFKYMPHTDERYDSMFLDVKQGKSQ